MKRIVLDTDVVVAAFRSRDGASAALLGLLAEGRGTMLVSVALALEYEAVCGRPEHIRAAGLDRAELDAHLEALISMAEAVGLFFRWRPRLRDPEDEMVLDVAINGRADWLVTFNRQDYGNAPAEFGIEVLSPREALLRMRL